MKEVNNICDKTPDTGEKRAMMMHTNADYPEDKNPFGYCDDEVPEDINQETNHGCELKKRLSLNPFGSDLDSEDDENTVVDTPTS